MTARSLLAAFVAALLAAIAPAAVADSGVVVFFGGISGERQLRAWDLPVRFEGSVTVHFESAFGNGESVWAPGDTGQATAALLQSRTGARFYSAFIGANGDHDVISRVDRPGGVCTDLQTTTFDAAAVVDLRDGIRVGLASPTAGGGGFEMTASRCGGPTVDDIGRALPMGHVTRMQLEKGGFDIDLRGDAPLAVGGMQATVKSTLVIHVGKRTRPRRPPSFPDSMPKPMRRMVVSYALERVSGTIGADLGGNGGACADLDSCGATETLAVTLGRPARGSHALLAAVAPKRRPVADLRTALGLAANGRSAGVQASGGAFWASHATTLSVKLMRNGTTVCDDTRHLANLQVELTPKRHRVDASLSAADSARTVCPGVSFTNSPFDPTKLASGSVPLRQLARRRLVLHLTRGGRLGDDAWSGSTSPDVTIVLRRTAVRTSIERY